VTGRSHSLIAVLLALSVLAILVSPFAASELSTLRATQKITPPLVAVTVALFTSLVSWVHAPGHTTWEAEQQLVLAGSAIVDLTSARLC